MTAIDRLLGLTGNAAIKAPCRVVATANITLNGLQTIDGVALAQDDRVLVTAQTSGIDNGIYKADTGEWTRDVDFNGTRDAVQGTIILIAAGTVYSGTLWRLTTSSPVIGTTALAFDDLLSRLPGLLPAGTNSISGGKNAAGQAVASLFPHGDDSGAPGAAFGVDGNGFATSNFYNMGYQTIWYNRAQSNTDTSIEGGALMNVINGYPGITGPTGGQYRWQNYDTSGDFRTDGRISMRIGSATSYVFTGDTTSGSGLCQNLKFNPTTFAWLQDVIDAALVVGGGLYVRLHSNSGNGIGGAQSTPVKIVGLTASTLIMDPDASAASANLTAADLSLVIMAPAANYDGVHDFFSFYFQPFTGNLSSGSRVISNTLFNPQRVGLIPGSVITGASRITTLTRVINYRTDGATHAIQLGEATYGAAINGNSSGSDAFTIDTTTNQITVATATVSNASSWVAVDFNPVAQAIPTDGTACYDRPQTGGQADLFALSPTVSSISSTSITYSSNASATLTQIGLKAGMARTEIEGYAFAAGSSQRFFTWGYSPTLRLPATVFRGYDVYASATKVIDIATAAWTGPLLYGADAGATDAYVITMAAEPPENTPFVFLANTANTGGATLSINGAASRDLVKAVNTTLSNNDILASMLCLCVDNGTNYVLLNPRAL